MRTLDAALRRIRQVPPEQRQARAAQVAEALFDTDAQACLAYLLQLRNGHLFADEADLLQCLAQRLHRPVTFRHTNLYMGQALAWQSGRYRR